MKKLIILTLLACFAFPVIAQEEISEEPIVEKILLGEENPVEEVLILEEVTPEPTLIAETTELIEVAAENLGVREPTLLPNNGFYFMKEFSRNFRLFFTLDSVKKAELRQEFADQQLLELKKLAENDDAQDKIIERAQEKYQKQQEKLGELLGKIKETTSDRAESFKEKYFNHQILHDDILGKLEGVVSKDIVDRITQIRNTHVEKFGENMFKLENMEQIPARIENALKRGTEQIKNSNIVNQIQERVQTQGHVEALQQTQERVMNQIKEGINQIPEQLKEQIRNVTEETQDELPGTQGKNETPGKKD